MIRHYGRGLHHTPHCCRGPPTLKCPAHKLFSNNPNNLPFVQAGPSTLLGHRASRQTSCKTHAVRQTSCNKTQAVSHKTQLQDTSHVPYKLRSSCTHMPAVSFGYVRNCTEQLLQHFTENPHNQTCRKLDLLQKEHMTRQRAPPYATLLSGPTNSKVPRP